MDTAEDLQQIARFNSEIMTQEEMKQIYSQKYDEIKKLKEENEKLKKEIDEFEEDNKEEIGQVLKLFDEIEKLKEENEDLNNTLKNAIKIIDATAAYDIDLDCDNEVDDYLEGLLEGYKTP